jgi:hypothetical protein
MEKVLMEQEEAAQPPRRLVGIDLGISSRHSVRVLEADGQVVVPVVMRAGGGVVGRSGAGGAGRRTGRHHTGGGVRVRPVRRGCRSRCSSPAACPARSL